MSRAEQQLLRAIRNISNAYEKGLSNKRENIEEAIKLLEGAQMYLTEQREVLKDYIEKEGED